MRRVLFAALVLAACARDITAPGGAVQAHDVLIAVAMPGRCLVGGCDPPSADRTHLGLISVLNTGSATAYLQACGTQASLAEQQFVDGAWVFVGPAVTCPNTPGPIALAAGDSIQVNWFFATGVRRIVLGVGGQVTMADEALSASARVDVP